MNKQTRKKQILQSAKDVFGKRGYHATKIEDIVSHAGVARGTFYLYFSDKRSVFEALIDRVFTRLGMAILRVDIEDSSRTVEQQVEENILRIVRTLLEDRAMTKLLLSVAVGIDTEFDTKLLGFYEELGQLLENSLRDGQALGIVKQGDVHLHALFTLGALKEIMYQVVMRGLDYSEADISRALFSFLREGCLCIPKTGA